MKAYKKFESVYRPFEYIVINNNKILDSWLIGDLL